METMKPLTEKELVNRAATNPLDPTTEATLKHFVKFVSLYPHDDVADIGGANYEKNLIPHIGETFDVYDPFYDKDFDICQRPLPRQYQTIVCMNTLEHVYDPVRAADNILASLKDNGFVFISVPGIYHQHDYDGVPDYYRYTDTALKYLFRELHCVDCWYDFDLTEMYAGVNGVMNPYNRLSFIGTKQ